MGMNRESSILAILLLGFIFLDALVLCLAKGNVHHYTFVLKNAKFTRLCSTKSMLTVNGSFPGPTIQAYKGDTIYVNVINKADYGVTIHWHGVKQPRNPWSDGPENVTQCPIEPGKKFTQEIILSDEEGTIWWHAHSDWSRATVHGAIVVLPEEGTTYPFPKPDGEQTIFLASWFKGDVMTIFREGVASGGSPNLSDAYTINGQPGALYPCSKRHTFRMLVEQGKTYLLRIVNGAMNEEHFFGIAGHQLTVVGQDGAYIKNITTDYLFISSGQTMDVLVTADQAPSSYYMAFSPYTDAASEPIDNTTTTAIFQYETDDTLLPLIQLPNILANRIRSLFGNEENRRIPLPILPAYNDQAAADNFTSLIRSLASDDHPINVPSTIDERIYITVAFNMLSCGPEDSCPYGFIAAASLNNISFVTNRTDILQAYYNNISGVFGTDFPDEPPYYFDFTGDVTGMNINTTRGTQVKVLEYGEAVEIVFQGVNFFDYMSHPMHLHGYSFYVVGSGERNFDDVEDPKHYNLDDPPLVNTVNLPRSGWVAIRFFADNPGVWFMHCHIERHATWGMNTVLLVKDGPTEETSMLPPPNDMPHCS